MTGLQLEGDFADINDKQLEFIKSVIEKRGYKNKKVIIKPLGSAGDNYIANVKRITIEDENSVFLKMIVKIAPQYEMLRKFFNTEFLFRNEHILYTKVLPKYTQLEQTHKVRLQDRFRYPICYGSSDEAPNEVIMMEDLNELNFKMLNRSEPLNNDCVRSILRNLALLHSLGFALKYKEPEVFDEFKNGLFDATSNIYNTQQSKILFKAMESGVVSILESDNHKKAVQGVIMDPLHNIEIMSKTDIDSKHSTIQHGDAWTNNFMFKFNGETITQSILIDYQIAKAANPAFDLLFMISTCTDYEARKEHFFEWIDYYHSELDKALSNYGLKSNIVYTKDQVHVDLKRYTRAVLGHTIVMVGLMALKPEEAELAKKAMLNADITAMATHNSAATSKDPETVAIFRKIIEDVIQSYHELGLLQI